MKNLKRILTVLLAVVAVASSASAQFRWGIKAGVNINSLNISSVDAALSDIVDTDNHTGFTGGLTAEFTIPVIGLGLDASAMYVHRVNGSDNSSDYIEIPINVKYKLGLPVIGHLVTPFAYTGPSFAFLCSGKALTQAYENKSYDASWNLGVGVLLVNHLQVSAGYGWGMTKAFKILDGVNGGNVGRANAWTITAAYLF